MAQPPREQRRRPTLFALVMLLVGSWASLASSGPSASAKASGTVVVSPQDPAAQVTIAAKGGPATSTPNLTLGWTATSESGVAPEVSMTSLSSELAAANEAPVSLVIVEARNADFELTVLNIDETGPVTFVWQAIAFMEGSDLDLSIAASAAAGQPSSAVTLPVIRPPFTRLRAPFTVFVVEAHYEASGTVTITRSDHDRETETDVAAIVGESLLVIDEGTTSVPTESAACVGDRCVLTATLAVAERPTLQVEVSDSDGSVTAVASEVESQVVWVDVPPLRLLSEISDLSIEVEMPRDPGNPFADHAVLVARISGRDSINGDLNCFAPIEYALTGEPYAELVSFAADEPGGRPISLGNGTTTTVDLRLGTTDPGQYCDVDSDNETTIAIGVMTIGVSGVLPAEVSLK